MLHLSISLRALIFVLLLSIAVFTTSDVARGAPAGAELSGDGLLMTNPGQNGARDIHTDNGGGGNLGGVRIYAGNSLANPPMTAALQFFGNGHTVFPGQAFIDSGAQSSAAIIFRTAATGQGLAERMRIGSDGRVTVGSHSAMGMLTAFSDTTTSALVAFSNGNGAALQVETRATGSGIWVPAQTTNDAVFVFNSGTGRAARFSHAVNGDATPSNHAVLIDNLASGGSADVLALQVGGTGAPLGSNNFITFFKGDDSSVGALEGNGSGSVVLAAPGSDYAEWLRRRDPGEDIRPGDIVGIVGGQVSKLTAGASQVMAISGGPIVAGNDPGEHARDSYAPVAFIGQVPVRVRGTVTAGDFIVASGDGDGVGVAVAPESLTAEQVGLIVGQAWQASDDDGEKLINVAVGLQRNPAIGRLITASSKDAERIATLEQQNARLEARLLAIEQRLSGGTVPLAAAR